ncbi:GNAT family N-acetyltransferase [Usitatibacter palustris]|uniref:Uncharacterized protein n=1 Tax=Usitatibacter palustris TaxID=2732487 RepID=A0A6M4HDV2_9PROT|nr:GNAT family N-acetyltransferase [Usitatibacter palustris]QJR16683.1 hypothetical protein DSM104440_03519 [Usitatibacter palustris]
MTDTLSFRHDLARKRFIGELNGTEVAYSEIDPVGADAILIKHTEVLPAHEGKGYGSALMRAFFAMAKEQSKVVIPVCPYAAAFIRKHPEYIPLVRPGYPL